MPSLRPSNLAPTIGIRAAQAASEANSESKSQWQNPSDILSLLLLIGGDVIQRAIAQLAGDDTLPTPVVFSFGWVAYTFTSLLSAVGDKRLMPAAPDVQSIVINTSYGHARSNQSWILGRVLRDYERHWMPSAVRRELKAVLAKAQSPRAGLCISVFEADPERPAGRASRDMLWWTGYLVATIQLVVAAVPWIIWQDWRIFVVTVAGTILAFISASLPQWRLERWACRRYANDTICLTQGNGAQHALVIISKGQGLHLEDLANANIAGNLAVTTGPAVVIITVLWVCLLITVSGIHDHTWFLIAVGALGMLYTVVVAGAPRRPEAFGIPLKYVGVYVRDKAMEALKAAEADYPGVGQSMLGTFFPGGAREKDVTFWEEANKKQKAQIVAKAQVKQHQETLPRIHQLDSQALKAPLRPDGLTKQNV